MEQWLVLSGKGGTGKTTISSTLIEYLQVDHFADCDVDAPNLHLIHQVDGPAKTKDYIGMAKASIDPEACLGCGRCMAACRFHAIEKKGTIYQVNAMACESCGVCDYVCPADAVTLTPMVDGQLVLYDQTEVFSTATLKMGSGTSGKLVAQVKEELKKASRQPDLVLVDGSPGIGCPVMASMAGVDHILIVTEASLSGLSDLKRLVDLAQGFKMDVKVCINRYDLSEPGLQAVESYLDQVGVDIVGKIPYDKKVGRLLNQGRSLLSEPTQAGQAIKDMADTLFSKE